MNYVKGDLGSALPLIASGKVRDLYEVGHDKLLFVASDRISAYDVIMQNGIPGKGRILTLLTAFWLELLQKKIPHLKTHFVSLDLPAAVPQAAREALEGRSMVVRKLKVLPLEAIVRGYITGSAWSSYVRTGQVHGITLQAGLQESQKLPEPMFTPSTKAELGQHDENISFDEAIRIVGEEYAHQIRKLSLEIYGIAATFAQSRGIIIADTKFEFGVDEATGEVVLIDEVLTPDSSRFWSMTTYKVGTSQDSFDKQYLRDWLTTQGLKGKENVEMPPQVVDQTKKKYLEAFHLLTDHTISESLAT